MGIREVLEFIGTWISTVFELYIGEMLLCQRNF
jgi:hypothetical protein